MKSKELRAKAWDSLKGKYWKAFLASLIAGLFISIGDGLASFSGSAVEIILTPDAEEFDSFLLLGAGVIFGMALVAFIIGLLLSIFVSSPAYIGNSSYFIKNTDSTPSITEVFSGFKKSYGRNVGVMLITSIKLVLWTLLFIIPGIIKSYEYAIIPYILADDPEISSKEAFAKAKAMMKGNKWRLFKLEFSFIGWLLLCILTFGIGAFFLLPYMEAAKAEFYVELKNS